VLPAALRGEIRRLAAAGYPAEVCGILVGRPAGPHVAVERLAPARNRHPAPAARFELEPEDLVSAERAARRAGREIVGVWHSHPDAPPLPSAADRAAAWSGYAYLIVTVSAAGAGALRCWRLASGDDGALVEQPLLEI